MLLWAGFRFPARAPSPPAMGLLLTGPRELSVSRTRARARARARARMQRMLASPLRNATPFWTAAQRVGAASAGTTDA